MCGVFFLCCFFSPRILIPALHAFPLVLSHRAEEKEMKRKRWRKLNAQKTEPSQCDWSVRVAMRSAFWKRGPGRVWPEREVLGFDRKYEWVRSGGQRPGERVGTEVRILKCWRGKLGATEWKRSEGSVWCGGKS